MKQGLEKALEIIDKEKAFALSVNPIMALGMSQIEMLIKKELEDKRCLLQIDGEWKNATLTINDYTAVKESLEGELNREYAIKLDDGDWIDAGIIDNIKVI